jgi:translocation and assembly module TamA
MVAVLQKQFRKRMAFPWICWAAITLFPLLMTGCAWFSGEEKAPLIEEVSLDLPKISYKTEIKGEMPAEVEAHLKAVSMLLKLESRPPTSLNALYHRARNDAVRLKQGLADKGYFDAQVDFALTEDKDPVVVTMTITLGKQYEISDISIVAAEDSAHSPKLLPSKVRKAIQLQVGELVDLTHIQEANQRLLKHLRDHGYPYAEMAEPEGQIDRKKKRLHVIFRAIPGRYLPFGQTDVTGLKNLDPKFVRNRLVWQEGSRFEERQLEKTRQKLMGTGLFSGVEIKPQENAQEDETVPIAVHLTEGPPRTIGLGLKYATTEGIGGQSFWSHRNIFGGGEGLGLSLRGSSRLSRAKIELDLPDVGAPEQHLRNEVSATQERNRAYRNRSLDVGMRLERPFTDMVTGMIGITGEVGKVKRAETNYRNRLIGFPIEMRIDASNDLIDPKKGGRLTAQVTPYIGQSGQGHQLIISDLRGSYYVPLEKEKRVVLAVWAHGGTIASRSLENIAPNKRFYAGGAGSIRAYGYKLLGSLDSNNIPLGGRSILEYGVEGRFKITEKIGCVAFVEAGSLSSETVPDLSSQGRLWGGGVGVRYYTPIGPIRLDIATPMKRRRNPVSGKAIDSSYQFYLSVGQAF